MAARVLLALAYAVALGAFLTLGDLRTEANDGEPNDLGYVLIAAPAIAGLVLVAGAHALWLLPLVTLGFAHTYESCCWERPRGIGDGVDYLGYYPTAVFWGMPFFVAYAGLVLVARFVWRRVRKREASAPAT